jgi:hypothetical protein
MGSGVFENFKRGIRDQREIIFDNPTCFKLLIDMGKNSGVEFNFQKGNL